MDKENKVDSQYYVVDFKDIFNALWKKAWLIAVVALVAAAIGLSIAVFFVPAMYSSSVMLYVNNSSFSLGNTNIDVGSLSASRDLVQTYIVILDNRTTLEMVIEETGVPYEYEELSEMITAAAVDGTEIMRVTVTTEDPYEAARIANCISDILPKRISDIIEGSSMAVVDSGVPELEKVSPSVSRYAIMGFLIGLILSAAAVIVVALMDDTIQGEDYIVENYGYPLLAVVPDLLEEHGKEYSYYQSSKAKSGKG